MRSPDIMRKGHAHRTAKDYSRLIVKEQIEVELEDMSIHTAHNSLGWIAIDEETGITANASFDEGEGVAIKRCKRLVEEKKESQHKAVDEKRKSK